MKSHGDSWEHSSQWYHNLCKKGSFYHNEVILPKLPSLLELDSKQTCHLIDFGCGEGVILDILPPSVQYIGIDLSPTLLSFAKKKRSHCQAQFFQADCQQSSFLQKIPSFSPVDRGIFLLSLQNMKDGKSALFTAKKSLKNGGKLILILNHPCFRIPRQTHWHTAKDETSRSRLIQRYMSPLTIPIQMKMSVKNSDTTLSYHTPLSTIFNWLQECSFVTELLEEWCSPKQSQGRLSKIENFSRQEIPLFIAIRAVLKN